jgi:hypothetical protein
VTSGGCPPDTTGILNVEVITVAPPVTEGDTICGPGTVNLQAQGAGGLNWYTAATGGSPVDTGVVYNPSIGATTTFYVEATTGGGTANVGPATNGFGNQNSNASNDFGLQFDVIQQVTLVRVYIYSQAAGNVTVNLRAVQGGPILNTVTVPVNAFTAHYPVNLNWSVPPGTGYRLELASGSPNLYYNSSGAVYPYTYPNSPVTITGYLNPAPATGGIYYYFYDWIISTGCASFPRTPVTGVVLTPPAVPTIMQAGNQLTSSSPSNNQWYLNGTAIPGATAQVYIATGPGAYTVVVTDPANGCTSESLPVVITSVQDNLALAGVSVYPNPVADELVIESQNKARLAVYNATGEKVVDALELQAGEKQTVDTRAWAQGIYVIELTGKEKIYSRITKW